MERFAQLLNLICFGGCCYLLYLLWFLEITAEPTPYWTLATGDAGSDKSTAVAMFFVGIFVALLVIFVVYLIVKFAFNLFASFIAKVFPESLQPIAYSIIALAILGCCFLGKETVKMTALNINCQINEVFSLAKPISPEEEPQ